MLWGCGRCGGGRLDGSPAEHHFNSPGQDRFDDNIRHQDFHIGQKIEGRLEKRESFGCFINLKPGITGLLPKSKIAAAGSAAAVDKLKEGQPIPVIIESINPAERKMGLAPADAADEKDWQQFSDNEASSFGELGDKLQQALRKKSP